MLFLPFLWTAAPSTAGTFPEDEGPIGSEPSGFAEWEEVLEEGGRSLETPSLLWVFIWSENSSGLDLWGNH